MTRTIGIIGAGHLGRTLAAVLRDNGSPADRILVSYGGNPATLDALRQAGLEKNICDNQEICKRASVIFVTVRPQSVAALDNIPFRKESLVVSCMAAIPRSLLRERWGFDVVRMMPSGPDTLREKNGIAGIYPENPILRGLLEGAGIRVFDLPDEEMMQVFTAGVCLTAAILAAREMDLDAEIPALSRKYPLIAEMCPWAKSVLPAFLSDSEREAYIMKMSTKGGITEAVVNSIRSGASLADAMEAGVARVGEISAATGSHLGVQDGRK